jgi:hypothetical protein
MERQQGGIYQEFMFIIKCILRWDEYVVCTGGVLLSKWAQIPEWEAVELCGVYGLCREA